MVESELVLGWIESTLSGDSTLQGLAPGGVSQTFALPGTTPPYTLAKYLNGASIPQFGGIAYSDMRFRVTVVGPIASQGAIASAADRTKTLLTVTQQTNVIGGTLISSIPDQPISDDEWVDGAKWHVSGNEYRVMAKSS